MSADTHSVENALNTELLPDGFMAAAAKSWCWETCWPPIRKDHNQQDNPSFGNCLVTTLAAWAARDFQDAIIPGIVNDTDWHFRLGLQTADPAYKGQTDDCGTVQVDATWQQFSRNAQFRELTCLTPEARDFYKDVISESLWEDDSLAFRLESLMDRMNFIGGFKINYSAREIINKAQEQWQFIFAPDFVSGPANTVQKPSPS